MARAGVFWCLNTVHIIFHIQSHLFVVKCFLVLRLILVLPFYCFTLQFLIFPFSQNTKKRVNFTVRIYVYCKQKSTCGDLAHGARKRTPHTTSAPPRVPLPVSATGATIGSATYLPYHTFR